MSQYVYTMSRVSKVVPPQKQILKDIVFFSGQNWVLQTVRVNQPYFALSGG